MSLADRRAGCAEQSDDLSSAEENAADQGDIAKATGKIVGATGLHRTVWTTPKTEIGYWARASSGRKGLITEAVMALTDYAVSHIGAVRVEIITDEENLPSRRVAERCQFTLEGILRNERRAPDGSLRNACIYARIRQ